MAGELQGKGALVTGGASGIGRATVLALAQAGATVAVLDRDEKGVEATVALAKQSGGNAIAVPIDLAVTAQIAPTGEINDVRRQAGNLIQRLTLLMCRIGYTSEQSFCVWICRRSK